MFIDDFVVALNDPSCSILSGVVIGELFAFQGLFYMLLIFGFFKLVDKLAFDPLVSWVKSKYEDHIVIKKKKDFKL